MGEIGEGARGRSQLTTQNTLVTMYDDDDDDDETTTKFVASQSSQAPSFHSKTWSAKFKQNK